MTPHHGESLQHAEGEGWSVYLQEVLESGGQRKKIYIRHYSWTVTPWWIGWEVKRHPQQGRDMSVMFGTVVMATQHSFLRNMSMYTRKYPCTILVVMKYFGKSNVFYQIFFFCIWSLVPFLLCKFWNFDIYFWKQQLPLRNLIICFFFPFRISKRNVGHFHLPSDKMKSGICVSYLLLVEVRL